VKIHVLLFAVPFVGVLGCAGPSAHVDRKETLELRPVIELSALVPAVGDRGCFMRPYLLAPTKESLGAVRGAEASGDGTGLWAAGPFLIVGVERDPDSWRCEMPAASYRVRMLGGEHAGVEGWIRLVGYGGGVELMPAREVSIERQRECWGGDGS
jgi:hypothetical protein